MLSKSQKYDFFYVPGQTWNKTLTYYTDETETTPLNMTGYTASLIIYKHASNSTSLEVTSGSGITLGGALGTITISLSRAQTQKLNASNYYYLLTISTAAGQDIPLMYGSFNPFVVS